MSRLLIVVGFLLSGTLPSKEGRGRELVKRSAFTGLLVGQFCKELNSGIVRELHLSVFSVRGGANLGYVNGPSVIVQCFK